MPYFPTDQDWTLITRPSRVPLEERFPKHLAVNALPSGSGRNPLPSGSGRNPLPSGSGSNPLRPGSGHSPKRATCKQKGKEKEGAVDILMNRSQPNLVPLSRRREEGELSDAADRDTFLDQTDMAAIEETLGWQADTPYMAGRWSDQSDGKW